MRVLVIGARGQLGADICNTYTDCELYRADLDGEGDHLVPTFLHLGCTQVTSYSRTGAWQSSICI